MQISNILSRRTVELWRFICKSSDPARLFTEIFRHAADGFRENAFAMTLGHEVARAPP
jgi:hypothetical protein